VKTRGFRTSDDLANQLVLDKSEPLVPTEMGISQPLLVQTELVQDRRVDVAKVIGLLDRPQSHGVRSSHDATPSDPATGQPHRETQVIVVASLVRLGLGRATELTGRDDQRGDVADFRGIELPDGLERPVSSLRVEARGGFHRAGESEAPIHPTLRRRLRPAGTRWRSA